VRLTVLSTAAARQARADLLRRDRAAAAPIRVAFPGVQQVRLDLTFESATAITPAAQSHVLHPPARAFFAYPCPYADCDGQFDLTDAARAALADPAHRTDGVLACGGARSSDRASKQPCVLRLFYAVTVLTGEPKPVPLARVGDNPPVK
jgi:hypothetical protein